MLDRLPAELILELAALVAPRRESHVAWLAWRSRILRLCLVCRYLRSVLEPVVWETVWAGEIELARIAQCARVSSETACPHETCACVARQDGAGWHRVKRLRLDGRFQEGLVVGPADIEVYSQLESLEVDNCRLSLTASLSPIHHLTSLWLDTINITHVQWEVLTSDHVTPNLRYLSVRRLHSGAVGFTQAETAFYFPHFAPDLVQRLGVLQVDLTDRPLFPPDLFTLECPVVLTWRCWHAAPSSLAAVSRHPRHLVIGHVYGNPAQSKQWFVNSEQRLVEWVKYRSPGARTLILPAGLSPYNRANDPYVRLGIQHLLAECAKNRVLVEWHHQENWQEEYRLHRVLEERRFASA
ncbi:hypothetical protein Rhopal_003402-T1 [Rhodotorula paludigena]|uniref:F-box domain-containing protein n=1 Tax=Rhodotorula paludigena TaxID=86838 RepID=A0AAV5GCV2_9BASI|nr:hypothetical protein Rhopal_003402-T1 [Rhodotorula paludigena]